MATPNSVDIGGADRESEIGAKLAAFVDGQSYPFSINLTNASPLPLVFPWLSGDVIAAGSTVPVVVANPAAINDLFNAAVTLGQLNSLPVLVTVALPGKATDKGATA